MTRPGRKATGSLDHTGRRAEGRKPSGRGVGSAVCLSVGVLSVGCGLRKGANTWAFQCANTWTFQCGGHLVAEREVGQKELRPWSVH